MATRKTILLLGLLGSLVNPLHSQSAVRNSGVVSGRVLNAESGQPVAGVSIAVEREGRVETGALTGASGTFSIPGVGPGPIRIRAKRLGYLEEKVEVRVRPGGTAEVQIRLPVSAVDIAPLEIIGESSRAHRQMTGTATKLDARVVEQVRPLGTQELLQHVPGVMGFADDGIGNSRISIGIRGLNPRRSSRVLVLEDGVPIQPAIYLYPNMYYNPPAERIDKVEVIKGSAAIEYGPQTMGGVVNYTTRRPRREFGMRSDLTAGTNGYLSLLTEVGGWGNDVLHPELQLLFKRGEGFRENNGFEQYNGTFKLNVVPDADRTFYIKANANYENSNATYTGLTEYSFRTNPNFNPKRHDNFEVARASLDILYDRRHGEKLTASTKAYFNVFDRRWWREKDIFVRASDYEKGAIVPVTNVYRPDDLVRVGGGEESMGILRTFYVAGVEHAYKLAHRLLGGDANLQLGARLHKERFIDDRQWGDRPDARTGVYYLGDASRPDSVTIVGQSHHYETAALALFAAERMQLGRLTLTPGVRFEVFEQERIDRLSGSQYQDKTSWVVLPGLGANYEMGNVNLFAGIHRGYTPPSSGTLKIVDFGEGTGAKALDLRPERSWNVEAGARGSFSWLAFESALFHVAIEDLVAAGRGTAFENLGRTRSYGFELAGTLRGEAFSPFLPDMNVAYTFLRTGVVDGRLRSGAILAGTELPYAPRHTLVVGLSRELSSGASLRTDVRYVDDVFTDFENFSKTYHRGDTGPVPAYTVVDAGVSFPVGERFRASLTAKNLLDAVYIGSRLHSNPGQPEAHLSSGIIPGPRRQINFGLTYTF